MKEKIKQLTEKTSYDITDLREIMKILRSENGCPWDREQNHTTIRQNFIEETYEAIEAIDNDDMPLLREELGDVLLQVIFHARICEEDGFFSFDEVSNDICVKLIERHPHIFGTVKADTSAEVLRNWEQIKQNTKQRKNVPEMLEGVAKSLPSLMRAGKLAKKMSKNGYAFPPSRKLSESEYGDALFSLAAECALNGIDPEKALFTGCEEFIAQFQQVKTSPKVNNIKEGRITST